MKKNLMVFLLFCFSLVARDFSTKIFSGAESGNWRLRNPEKLNDFDSKNSFSKGALSLSTEIETKLHEHMYILAGLGYESEFLLNDNLGSYELMPIYFGGRMEYFKTALWNPYIVGRIGYPIFLNKKNIPLENSHKQGWANLGFGVTYK